MSVLLSFLKNQFSFHWFFVVFYFIFLLSISGLNLGVSSHQLFWGVGCPCSSKVFRDIIKLLVWDLSNILIRHIVIQTLLLRFPSLCPFWCAVFWFLFNFHLDFCSVVFFLPTVYFLSFLLFISICYPLSNARYDFNFPILVGTNMCCILEKFPWALRRICIL